MSCDREYTVTFVGRGVNYYFFICSYGSTSYSVIFDPGTFRFFCTCRWFSLYCRECKHCRMILSYLYKNPFRLGVR